MRKCVKNHLKSYSPSFEIRISNYKITKKKLRPQGTEKPIDKQTYSYSTKYKKTKRCEQYLIPRLTHCPTISRVIKKNSRLVIDAVPPKDRFATVRDRVHRSSRSRSSAKTDSQRKLARYRCATIW